MPGVLVVQRHAEIRSLIALLLRQRGYEVFPAAGLEEAARFAADEIGLICLDLHTPGVDPRQPLHAFRSGALGPRLVQSPILLTDVDGLLPDGARRDDVGADGLVTPRRAGGGSLLAEAERLLPSPPGPQPVHTWRLDKRELPPFLYACYLFGVTGALTLRDGRLHKQLFFVDGWIRGAASSVESDWLGKMLLARRQISPEALNEVERALATSKRRIGEELVARGRLSETQLNEALEQQYAAIAMSVFEWDGAEISLGEGRPQPPPYLARHPFQVTLAGVRAGFRDREADDALGPLDQVPRRAAWTSFRLADVQLAEPERDLLNAVDGRRSFAQIIGRAALPPPDAKKFLLALAAMRVIVLPPDEPPALDGPPAWPAPPLVEDTPAAAGPPAATIDAAKFDDDARVAANRRWIAPLRAALSPRRPYLWLALFYLTLGFVLAQLPLTNYLGLEFCLAVGVAGGFLGGPFAVGLFRRRTAALGFEAQRRRAAQLGAPALWGEAAAIHLAAALLSLVGLAVHVAAHGACAPWRGAGFFALLPVVSILYSSAWGLAFGSLIRRPWLAKLAVTALALATLAANGLDFITKPTVWVYNPFFGHYPGPIYDEAATPGLPLLAYRAGNLAAAALVVLLLSLVWRRWDRARESSGSARLARALCLVALAATVAGIHLGRFELGFAMDDAHLKKKLDGHIATVHFDIYYPRRADIERDIALVALDHEFRYAQVVQQLGIHPPGRIESFIYPDGEAKKKWIGAGGTEYAHCATRQMHLNWDGFPADVLHHELVHVMLAGYGLPFVGVSAKPALLEGMAVAFGGPVSWDEDIDRWAAGLKAMGRLPRIRDIMGVGFWGDSGARAYVAAGSFVRYLTTLPGGQGKLLAAYEWGDLAKYFGRSLDDLDAAWREQLTQVEAKLTPAAIERARFRFGFKSLFEMRCPREVARELDEAGDEAGKRYFARADLLYQRAAQLDRDEVRLSRLRLGPLLRLGRLDEAARLARLVRDAQGTPVHPALDKRGHVVGSQIIAHDAELRLAELAWARGDIDEARTTFQVIAEAAYRDGAVREAVCALWAFDHPEVEPALRRYFTDFTDTHDGRWQLLFAWRTETADPVLAYLMARRAFDEQDYPVARNLLDRALAAALPHSALIEETWRAKGYASFMLGDLPRARAEYAELRKYQVWLGKETPDADDWLARIDAWPALPGANGPPKL
jgi:CheY-like chemotaxis protein